MTVIAAAVLMLAALIAGLVWFSASTARKVETTLPPRGRFMEIDGERIHYVDTGGAGPAVVMIHGLGGNLLHFDYALAGRLDAEFRLILVDRPGSGYSTRAAGADATLTTQAAAIAKVIRALGLARPLVVGHSLGGATSLALALDHPDCVGGLALIAPLTRAQEEVPAVFRRLVIRTNLTRNLVAWTLATPLGILRGPAALKEVSRRKRLRLTFRSTPADFSVYAREPSMPRLPTSSRSTTSCQATSSGIHRSTFRLVSSMASPIDCSTTAGTAKRWGCRVLCLTWNSWTAATCYT
jgi:pimeloyl-ACP methyl ester carboxylesterase